MRKERGKGRLGKEESKKRREGWEGESHLGKKLFALFHEYGGGEQWASKWHQ